MFYLIPNLNSLGFIVAEISVTQNFIHVYLEREKWIKSWIKKSLEAKLGLHDKARDLLACANTLVCVVRGNLQGTISAQVIRGRIHPCKFTIPMDL